MKSKRPRIIMGVERSFDKKRFEKVASTKRATFINGYRIFPFDTGRLHAYYLRKKERELSREINNIFREVQYRR